MDSRKLPRTKPLLIIEQDREISNLFNEMEIEMAPLEEEHEKLHAMHMDLLNRQQALHKKHWSVIGNVLTKKEYIDDPKTSLYIDNGVLYQGKEPTIGFDMIKKLFSGNLDE